MILTVMATVGGTVLRTTNQALDAEPATEVSVSMFIGLMNSLPGLVTLAGIAGATVVAGPFGFVGALLETAGATQLFHHQSEGAIWMIFIGAALVTVGAPIPWLKVWSEL